MDHRDEFCLPPLIGLALGVALFIYLAGKVVPFLLSVAIPLVVLWVKVLLIANVIFVAVGGVFLVFGLLGYAGYLVAKPVLVDLSYELGEYQVKQAAKEAEAEMEKAAKVIGDSFAKSAAQIFEELEEYDRELAS